MRVSRRPGPYLVLCCTLAALPQPLRAQAPTGEAAPDIASRSIDRNGLGLTSQQRAMIVEAVSGEKPQEVDPGISVEIGAPVPDAMTLAELPVELKDRIGSLRDFKFARLKDDRVLLVEPATRTVADVVTK
ncbi:MAG TPA: hypothetical protein VHA55_14725 [Pseudorhodoplanes sp.]|jgi:hypothetical protein|nr:hypothetical protein [Pseudorhodoplanes sp.]